MIRVGVIGAQGKMGSQTALAVRSADDLELVAQVDVDDDLADLAGVDVAVDFTHPAAVMHNIGWCVAHGVNVVVGTSGFTKERLAAVESQLAEAPDVGVIVVPNFSIGAILMMRFAAEAARFYESVEIIELHHPSKADAPSGTARRTAELVAAARSDAGAGAMPDATVEQEVGARGATIEGVPVHSVRLRGLVAHQEVVFGSAGEILTVRHDSLGRESFLPGVLAAVRAVARTPGLTFGLDSVLGLA